MSRIVFVSDATGGRGALASACAVGVAAAGGRDGDGGVAVLDLAPGPVPRSGLLASAAARSLEVVALEDGSLAAAARGHICLLRAASSVEGGDEDALGAAFELDPAWLVVSCPPERLRENLRTRQSRGFQRAAVLVGGERPRAMLGLLAGELHDEGVRLKLWRRPPSWIAARRAGAGLDPGGALAATAARHLQQLFSLAREEDFG